MVLGGRNFNIRLAHTGIWTGVDDYVLEQHDLGKNFGFQKLFEQDWNIVNHYFARRSK